MLSALTSALGDGKPARPAAPPPAGWAPPLQRGAARAAGAAARAALGGRARLDWTPDVRLPAPADAAGATAAAVAAAPAGTLDQGPPPGARPPARPSRRDEAAAWFALPTQDVSGALKTELRLLALRGALDPTRHYKRPDSTKLPSAFHVGTVVEHASEYYSARLAKGARGRTLADELLRDAGATAVRKRRYAALQEAAAGARRGAKRRTGLPRERAKAKRPKH